MSVLTLGYSFESKLNDLNIKRYIFNIIRGRIASNRENFKKLLAEINIEFQQNNQISMDIKEMSYDDLKILNRKLKRCNNLFDKLNNIYYNENYFGDSELKHLFSSISRQAHKVENISHKYLFIDQAATQTPGYIKEGLTNFSIENIGKKLTPNK